LLVERKDKPRWWEVMVDYIRAEDIEGDLKTMAQEIQQALEVYKASATWRQL